jgi:hypothetical protein
MPSHHNGVRHRHVRLYEIICQLRPDKTRPFWQVLIEPNFLSLHVALSLTFDALLRCLNRNAPMTVGFHQGGVIRPE